jgi:RimJ/RimL family protein N-acetyltransferase
MTFLPGETVALVALDPDDVDHVEALRVSRTDPGMRATGWYGGALTAEQVRDRIREARDREREEARCAIEVDGETVGWARVTVRDDRARRADVGYYVLPDHQGGGYATEATGLLTAYAFEELNAHKVEASVQADNPESARVAEANGYRHEATIRDRMFKAGDYVDTEVWGILRGEFEE